jgi:hypothetical protein
MEKRQRRGLLASLLSSIFRNFVRRKPVPLAAAERQERSDQ